MNLRVLALVSVMAVGTAAQAWNAAGHMVIAAIARAKLDPAVRAEADRLLKIDATRPGSDDFVLVASWADEIRNERRETGGWHFKDLFFREDGKPPVNHAEEPNVVTEINRFSAILKDRTKPDAERAEALRFLIHFVGDIHQPLHATARETEAHPKGDRGGNDFLILPPDGSERGPRNLHSLWDSGAGLFANTAREGSKDAAEAEARALLATVPRSSLRNVSESNPDKWAQESFKDAKEIVYKTPEGKAPDAAYLEKSRALAARRAALAGYRLADLLNKTLGN